MTSLKIKELILKEDLIKIIRSNYFLNLKGKTQLISFNQNVTDRLKHSKMVCYVTNIMYREFADKVDLNKVILMAGALSHDLGHPPFGHDGERELNSIMSSFGGFESNAQSLLILKRYLKVSPYIITSVFKHQTPIPKILNNDKLIKGYYCEMSPELEGLKYRHNMEKGIIDLADEIAYCYSDFIDIFMYTNRFNYQSYKKSMLRTNIIDELYTKYSCTFTKKEIVQFILKVEQLIIDQQSFLLFVEYLMKGLVVSEYHNSLILSSEKKVQIDYLKVFVKRYYFTSRYYRRCEKKIKTIINSSFHSIREKLNGEMDLKTQYRMACHQLYLMSENELINHYKKRVIQHED